MSTMVARPPRVSVVIPTYNYARFLPRALDSVFAQTWRDHEIVVVDDGSTDDTPEVAKAYGERIRYLRKENGGVSSARNMGIEAARGELIAFLDADDAWREDKLARQVAFLDENPWAAMVFSDMSHWVNGREVHRAYLRERGYTKVASGRIFLNLLEECFIFVPTVMVRAACFREVGLMDTALSNSEDLDMWLRIAARFEIGFIDEPLALRHEHGSGATAHRARFHEGQIAMFSKVLASGPGPEARAVARRKLALAHWHLGYHLLSVGDGGGCRRNMLANIANGGAVGVALTYMALSLSPPWLLNALRAVFGRRAPQG